MVFIGISKTFDLTDEKQYDTIGQFWDEMESKYGLENLMGLGYAWERNTISYAIGLKNGIIDGCNVHITLPDDGWESVSGQTEDLKSIYDKIYQDGRLRYEIETFYNDGTCHIKYYRMK